MPAAEKITKSKIMAMADLPEPSAMLMNLIPMFSEENLDMGRLVAEISRDQALVARILKLVNSSYYHLKRKVDSVKAAVGLLGLMTIRQTVYSAVCYDYFPTEERESWSHSYTSSLLVSDLMRNNFVPQNGCLQLTALLHDIGKIVLRRKAPKKYRLAMFKCAQEGIPPHVAERELFGCDHAEVGSWLLEAWDMREEIVLPTGSHHLDSLPERCRAETAVLILADWIDNAARGLQRPPLSEEALNAAGVADIGLDMLTNAQRELIASVEAEQAKALEP